ncbi:MAG: phosphoribosylglycinamide formyltransferase [Bacillota bacterium]
MVYKIAVLASGRGSNLQALMDAAHAKQEFEISVVITDKKDAYALTRAREANIPAVIIERKNFGKQDDFESEILAVIRDYQCDLICLAGFMRILSPYFIKYAGKKIVNIHPSLLPAFPGLHAQKQTLEYGVKFSGCTVHFVDEGVDSGPIILQSVVPVYEDDTEETLSARILREEHKIYPQAVKLIAQGKVEVTGRKVYISG